MLAMQGPDGRPEAIRTFAAASVNTFGLDNLQQPIPQRRVGPRMLTDAGLGNNQSDVDEVVFGRDLDGSNNLVKDVRKSAAFSGASGDTTRQMGEIAYVQRTYGHRRKHFGPANTASDVDEVVFGRDLDFSNGAQKLKDRPEFDGACGRKVEARGLGAAACCKRPSPWWHRSSRHRAP